MKTRGIAAAGAAAALVMMGSAALAAPATCGLNRIVELPVTMQGLRPLVPAKINGADVQFVADSGAFYSLISPGSAAQYKLKLSMTPYRMEGVGGDAAIYVTTVKAFALSGVPINNVQFMVGGSETGGIGLLGQNVLGLADVEYDFAGGAIRLMKPHDCKNSAVLAYWAGGKPFSVMDIQTPSPTDPHTLGVVYVNGVRLKAMFDTGAETSVLTISAARSAGVKTDDPGVVSGGYGRGLGRHAVRSWIAPFASFKIGDEEVRTTKLRIGDVDLHGADMLLGADFFLSHRVYVANSQHKLYFTYNGGPVFNLEGGALTQNSAAEPPKASPVLNDGRADPTDAEGFSRRGAALASRREFDHAIADLTRAIELAPTEPRYLTQRGMAYWEDKQADHAMADFGAALKLKPDDVDTLLARAELRVGLHQREGALADLDAAGQAAPKTLDARYAMAQMYESLDAFEGAIAQFDLWIPAHEADSHRGVALSSRCRARALLGIDLDKALSDCNAAIGFGPKSPGMLTNRGLVRYRRGENDKALADFEAALTMSPTDARALYGRGLARLKLGKKTEGDADLAAATKAEPILPGRLKRFGIGP